MLQLSEPIQSEYLRWRASIGDDTPQGEQYTLNVHDVLRAHFLIANYFYEIGQGLGGIGPSSVDLLHSAVQRQNARFGGTAKWSDKFDICATLFFGLIKDHPFHDANKRTAFLTCLYQLHTLGKCVTIPQIDFENFTVEIANNKLERYSRFREMKNTSCDPEVLFISHYLRRNTREVNKRYYIVSYKELDRLLRRFDCELANPHGNYIDVIRNTKKPRFLGLFGKKELIPERVTKIGFPGWTAQVNQKAIASVRRAAGLTYDHGIDSETFFHGSDPIDTLLSIYQEPLRRLAQR